MADKPTRLIEATSSNRIVVQTAVLAGLASIPYVGPTVHVALSSYLEQKKEKKWQEFWNGVLERVDVIDNGKIDVDYFSSENFFDRVESIYNEICMSSDKDKINYLRDFVISCAKENAPDTSWIEIYYRHLARMTGSHLICLKSIYDIQSQLSEMERFFRRNDRAPLEASAILGIVGSKWDADLIEIILADLQSAGLVQAVGKQTNANEFGWSITNIGIKFMGFVTLDGAR